MSTKEYPIVENAETFEAALAKVKEAQKIFATYTQEQVDTVSYTHLTLPTIA